MPSSREPSSAAYHQRAYSAAFCHPGADFRRALWGGYPAHPPKKKKRIAYCWNGCDSTNENLAKVISTGHVAPKSVTQQLFQSQSRK